nr:hypothetical protein [Tanacetum cinerariifolium]
MVIFVQTDKGIKFLNKTLHAFFKEEGIEHQTSTPRTPEQNGVVKRRNRTLVEAAWTTLSSSKLLLFFWAEAIATACYTQNRSIIIPTNEKTTYHIINDRKPSIKHLYIFGCTCYLTRDGKNLDKMKEKGDPCILVRYFTQSKRYRVYNKRIRLIVESIHLRFDKIKEMSETSIANDTSGLVPQRQKASDYDNSNSNGVVKRRNRTLVEAAWTMLSSSKLPLFFWAEAITTACYTQNRSIIIPTNEKTTYHIINDRKPSIKHLHIFGCTCYLTRDGENLDKMKEKGDPCILVRYFTQSKGYRVYNKRIRLIVESIHLRFDKIKEMSETSVANDNVTLY